VANVLEELELLKETYKKIDYIEIVDGTFTYDQKYVQEFCNAVISRKLDIPWRCTARYDNLSEALLHLMKQANCAGLYLGLESGSERILKSIDKKTNVGQIIQASQMLHRTGIPSATSIIMGLPDEGKEDMEQTLKLMKKVRTDIFDVNSYIPLAGTTLYDAMNEEDKRNIDWRKVGYKSFDSHFSKSVSHEDFKQYLSRAYKIAGTVRNRTLVRFGVRMPFHFVARKLKKLWNDLLPKTGPVNAP
jgi:radical SAM superfamily enzyme YgiQ (UPF0313 family)